MSLPKPRGAYTAIIEKILVALNNPDGYQLTFQTETQAVRYRQMVYRAREIMYEEGIGVSDLLATLTVRREGRVVWVEPRDLGIIDERPMNGINQPIYIGDDVGGKPDRRAMARAINADAEWAVNLDLLREAIAKGDMNQAATMRQALIDAGYTGPEVQDLSSGGELGANDFN